jgi:hypothetical protein
MATEIITEQWKLGSLLTHNNDLRSHHHNSNLEYRCCLWCQCCISYSIQVRMIHVHISFGLCLPAKQPADVTVHNAVWKTLQVYWWCSFGLSHHVDGLVETTILEKRTFKWFISALKTETAQFSEMLASTNQSARRLKPKDYQNCHCRENLISHFWNNFSVLQRVHFPNLFLTVQSIW